MRSKRWERDVFLAGNCALRNHSKIGAKLVVSDMGRKCGKANYERLILSNSERNTNPARCYEVALLGTTFFFNPIRKKFGKFVLEALSQTVAASLAGELSKILSVRPVAVPAAGFGSSHALSGTPSSGLFAGSCVGNSSTYLLTSGSSKVALGSTSLYNPSTSVPEHAQDQRNHSQGVLSSMARGDTCASDPVTILRGAPGPTSNTDDKIRVSKFVQGPDPAENLVEKPVRENPSPSHPTNYKPAAQSAHDVIRQIDQSKLSHSTHGCKPPQDQPAQQGSTPVTANSKVETLPGRVTASVHVKLANLATRAPTLRRSKPPTVSGWDTREVFQWSIRQEGFAGKA
ncbi:hypothetical protein NDN08_005114 [Rhodosorus marinus]|uniref:Uncharacterized protein n=1 Tax=Rhodosorus marinus TaxID=101924 RepID=A0AAV8V0L2_9RHOD|nr:hypothetical protein NDN08_005114 [Rhodosorus marinus]